MQFNKCSRCGCFFMTNSDVCPNCEPKDMCDINKLKNYLSDCETDSSIEEISCNTGISPKNLHRFLQSDKIAKLNLNDFGIKFKTEL